MPDLKVEEVQQLEVEEVKAKAAVLEVIQDQDGCCDPVCGPDTCPCP